MGRVQIEHGLGGPLRPIAAVFLHGELDLGSRGLVAEALEPLRTDVLVDLSWCTFLDSAIIGLIVAKRAELAATGHLLELIVPAAQTHLAALGTCLIPASTRSAGVRAHRHD